MFTATVREASFRAANLAVTTSPFDEDDILIEAGAREVAAAQAAAEAVLRRAKKESDGTIRLYSPGGRHWSRAMARAIDAAEAAVADIVERDLRD